jgi:hypothetical protein
LSSNSRVSTGGRANAGKVALTGFSWDPNDDKYPISAFDTGTLDVTPQCLLDGVNEPEACRLFVLRTEDACPPAAGLEDPVGNDGKQRPQYETQAGTRLRVCQLPALSGDALVTCRDGGTCDDCGVGWCTTDNVPEACSCNGALSSRVRLIGDAFGGQQGILAVLCD